MFTEGTVMYWKHNGKPAYQKLDNDWWVSLDSTYVVNSDDVEKRGVEPIVRPESDKPLYRNGKVNRFGFNNSDEGVWEYYKDICHFKSDV